MHIKLIDLETASDCWDVLSPLSGIFSDVEIFRGHGDATWDLLPSAFREIKAGRHNCPSAGDPYADVVNWEAKRLNAFVNHLDALGFEVPGDSMETRRVIAVSMMDRGTYGGLGGWPFEAVLPALTLAQHQGVATRLLDWTTRSAVAMYFAALNCLQQDRLPAKFAIWVAHPSAFK